MAIRIVINVDGAADVLAGAGAGAKVHPQRDTSVTFDAPADLATIPLVSGTDRYEAWDASGSSTSWYRSRLEKSDGTAWSDWSTPWQVTAELAIATLAGVKQRLGTTAATDDDMLERYVRKVNTAIIRRLGYYPGPASDTERLYDGRDAVRDATRLYITGGFRSLSKVELASGGTFSEVAAADWMAGPKAWALAPGEPCAWIDLLSGTIPTGAEDVRLTGIFGWASPPADLVDVAETWAVRNWKARASGDADVLGSDEFGNVIVSDRIPPSWRNIIDSYRTPMVA